MSRNDFEQGILKAVADDGMNLSLLDGTKWVIRPEDISTVSTWVPGATVRIAILIEESPYPYMLYHTGTGSSVRARQEQ